MFIPFHIITIYSPLCSYRHVIQFPACIQFMYVIYIYLYYFTLYTSYTHIHTTYLVLYPLFKKLHCSRPGLCHTSITGRLQCSFLKRGYNSGDCACARACTYRVVVVLWRGKDEANKTCTPRNLHKTDGNPFPKNSFLSPPPRASRGTGSSIIIIVMVHYFSASKLVYYIIHPNDPVGFFIFYFTIVYCECIYACIVL